MQPSPPKMKKKIRRRRGSGKHYFTSVHEEKIVEYSNSSDQRVRTEIYINYIQPVFNEMVDKIVYTYKFTNLPNIDSLKEECKVWLTTILDKFDPSKGSKAFSYFSVITKNWFIQEVKKNTQRMKREIQYEDISFIAEKEELITYNPYMKHREDLEFWNLLVVELETWGGENLKEKEKMVLEAIKILFAEIESIEIFNKKAIYLYLREITGLNTKQVINNLNKIRIKYRIFKKKWDKGEL